MSYHDIEQVLKQRIGLHAETIGSASVSQAVEQRMQACDVADAADYLKILSHSQTELDALIDTVVIPETWFYRDWHPFMAFREWVSSRWSGYDRHTPLRILSIPCSSGEEAYTLAMCLADLGLSAEAAKIDAIDISHGNIEKALAARYGNNSFRSKNLNFRDKYFSAEGQRFRLDDAIRARVNFRRGNLFDEALLQQPPYQIIFCRNLLIYFDLATQHRAIDRLDQLLSHDGLIFLGHSETGLLLDRAFTALSHPRSFGFSRAAATAPGKQAATPKKRPKPRRETADKPATAQPFAAFADREVTSAAEISDADMLLEEAFKLADCGQLQEAAQRCEQLLREQYHLADAHFLLGLVHKAEGRDDEAAAMFRKAIYLQPHHYQALTHLSVICEQQGDRAGAQRLQARATRAQQRKPVEEDSS